MRSAFNPPEQRVYLRDISWSFYETILDLHVDKSAPRFTYHKGTLEIISLGSHHEFINGLIKSMVSIWAEEMKIDLGSYGSATVRSERLHTGFEADATFFIQSAKRIKSYSNLELMNTCHRT